MVNPVDPFVFPKNPSPVVVTAQRLQRWQSLATLLAGYADQLADINRSNGASNERLVQVLRSSDIKPQDDAVLTLLPGALEKLHSELLDSSRQSSSSLSKAASRLRNIANDAQSRAENIMTYNNHFALAYVEDTQTKAKAALDQYQAALDPYDASADPHFLKSRVDKTIAAKINAENKLLESYHTVQSLAAKYDEKLVSDLNKAVREIEASFSLSGTIQVEFVKSLKDNVFAPHADDFEHFLLNNKEYFITEDVEARHISQARYEGQFSTAAKAVLRGPLERRTKYLKSFVPAADYLLTVTSLYEIKDGQRSLGIDLSDAELLEDHKHATDDRFVLKGRQIGSTSGKRHTWVFRSDNAKKWSAELKKILSVAPGSKRAAAVFGSETFDPESESHTLSPADASSTAALASRQVSPATAGAAAAGAAGADIVQGTNDETANEGLPSSSKENVKGGDGRAPGTNGAGAASGAAAGAATGAVASKTVAPNAAHGSAASGGVSPLDTSTAPGGVGENEPVSQSKSAGAGAGAAAGAGAGAGAGAAVATQNSSEYDDGSDSSVSEVNYVASPTEEEQSAGAAPPAHSAAWQAQQDLAAFDKKVGESAALEADDADSGAVEAGDADSEFSYDKKHRASTFTGEDYKPDNELPPHIERKLTQTYHKDDDTVGIGAARTGQEGDESAEDHIQRRRSSVSSSGRRPSRSATASYGDELKPLTSPGKAYPDKDPSAKEHHGDPNLFFADEIPLNTAGNPTVPGPACNAKVL